MPARRSARQSGPRTGYISDPFALAGVLSDDSDSEKPREGKGKQRAENAENISGSDEEFAASQSGEEEEEDHESSDEDADNASEDAEDERPPSSMEIDETDELGLDTKGTSKQSRRRPPRQSLDWKVMGDEAHSHSRGIFNPQAHTAKNLYLQVNFGTDERDLLAMTYTRDRWCQGIDSTFPTRRSLNEAESFPDYQYGPTFGSDPEDVRRERTHGWDWYYDSDIGGRFKKRQRLEKLEEDELRRVYLPESKGKHTVLVGPVDNQKAAELEQNESFNFGEAWGERKYHGKNTNAPRGSKAEQEPREKKKTREGWIVNLGNKIQALGWAPNQPGLTQYLAVVVPITEGQKRNYSAPLEGKIAPAFRPSAPYPCALQLWAFKAKKEDSLTKTMDMGTKPRPRLVLCTDWGDLRRLSWCPIARDKRDEDDEDIMRNVGLLAGVWSDGMVRVIDVKISRSGDATELYKVQSPVFAARPPSTVCTCLTWLSPCDIAVGCADGSVAIWNIAHSQPSETNPLPYFYHRVHSTFILSIASAYPTYPHLIATTSMDGETRLTSIIDPQTDVAETGRMRIASPYITFSQTLQSFFSGEENDFIRLLPIRRFFSSTFVSRLPGVLSVLAPCSPWHPTVLAGSTSGAVIANNPTRKLMHSKFKQWQQIWFKHEWVRGRGASGSGVSRFFDGFRIEQVALLRNLVGEQKLVNGHIVITIHDEETHVTSLAWNPNQSCAGWAAAGMGCGLVRVEDVAL